MLKEMKISPRYIFVLIKLLFLLCGTTNSYSQTQAEDVQAVVKGEQVYLYQLQNIRMDFGYNIYRKDPGGTGFVRLNEEPVRGIDYPGQLRAALGKNYNSIRRNLEVEDLNRLYSQLKSNSLTAKLYALSYPEVAIAVNRLFIDQSAPVGQEVIYKIEILNQRDEVTGDIREFSVMLEEREIVQPEITEITNQGEEVTLTWRFEDDGNQDQVFRFSLLQQNEQEDNLTSVTEKIVLKDRNESEYSFSFNAENLNDAYNYYVAAVDIAGRRGPMSEPVRFTAVDNTIPSTVRGVRTALLDEEIQVQWPLHTELDITGYNLYRSLHPDQGFELLNEQLIPYSEPLFLDKDLTRGNRYYYRVTAVDENGNESNESVVVARMVPDYSPPPMPYGLTANYIPGEDLINLNWATDPLPQDFKTFILFRRIVPENSKPGAYSAVTSNDITDLSFSDSGIDGTGFIEGATYQFGIIAADSSQNTSDTTLVTLQIPNLTPPEPPASITAVNRQGVRVNIGWQESSSTDVIQYRLYKKFDNEEFEMTHEFSVRSRMFRDEEIITGREVTYAVAAVDSAGNESEWNIANPVFVQSDSPPRKVRNVRPVAKNEDIHIKWEPVISDVLQGYKVYYSDRSTGTYHPLFDQIIDETEIRSSLNDGMIWFRVTAINHSGNESRPSEPVRIIRP